jgi:hypothetical protein
VKRNKVYYYYWYYPAARRLANKTFNEIKNISFVPKKKCHYIYVFDRKICCTKLSASIYATVRLLKVLTVYNCATTL